MMDLLTARERQIVEFIAAGMTNEDIGRTLNRSPRTVKNHVSSILLSLQLRTRTEVAAVFYRYKIAQLQDENAMLRESLSAWRKAAEGVAA